jgi:[pyruvate, water dikinase]-phosphate phosphotransferase / [pyruvate, water dikinase] kinase
MTADPIKPAESSLWGPLGDRHIFVVSDATGETAEKVVLAALSQFETANVILTRLQDVRTEPQVASLLKDAAEKDALIVYTIISPKLRALLQRRAVRQKVLAVDLMGSLLTQLQEHLDRSPLSQPGLLHRIDEDYFRRIDAVDFTVKHDDGQNPQTLQEADVVLTGISRTTKTPLSIYLAREGWKVANVPLVYGIEPPAELLQMDPRRIVGLMIDPQRLVHIRTARIRHLPVRSGMAIEYAEMDYVMKEIAYSKELFAQHPEWIVLDVTGRAVEELANEIVRRVIGSHRIG